MLYFLIVLPKLFFSAPLIWQAVALFTLFGAVAHSIDLLFFDETGKGVIWTGIVVSVIYGAWFLLGVFKIVWCPPLLPAGGAPLSELLVAFIPWIGVALFVTGIAYLYRRQR